MLFRTVVDGVGRIQTQAVDVEFMQPIARVVDHELAHPFGPRAVVVDCFTPRRVKALGEIVGRKVAQVVAVRSEVVVDDVQDDREAVLVRGVDEAFHGRGPAIDMGGREQIDAVIAPVALARELGHRQWLDRVDAERCDARQLSDQAIESALGRGGANVDLIDDQALDAPALPTLGTPAKGVRVDD